MSQSNYPQSNQTSWPAVLGLILVLGLIAAAGIWMLALGRARQAAMMQAVAAREAEMASQAAQLAATAAALQAQPPTEPAGTPPITPARSTPSATEVQRLITEALQQQQQAWNAGDIDGFMKVYWSDQRLTFVSGGEVTRGWQATLDRYKQRYPDSATMGQLTFDQLEFKPVGSEVMLVIGRWQVQRAADPIEGRFSLVWQSFDEGWRIVHDHTSLNQ